MSFAVADTAPHRPRHHCPPSGLCLTSCTPPPPQLSVAFAPTFPPTCYCCAPFRCIFSPHCPAFSPSPCVIMAVQGCGGQGFVRLRTMLHVEGGEIVRFFRVVRGGRNGRTVRANHISRREASVHIRMRTVSALSGDDFQPTHSQRKELCINTLASFYKRYLMSCSFVLNEQLINIE